METFTNNEDPDKMPHNGEFHKGLHCLLRLKRFADKKKQYYTIIDFNEVDVRIYLTEKVIIMNITFKGR